MVENLVKQLDILTDLSTEDYNKVLKKLKYIEDQKFGNSLQHTHYYVEGKHERPIVPQYMLQEINVMRWQD